MSEVTIKDLCLALASKFRQDGRPEACAVELENLFAEGLLQEDIEQASRWYQTLGPVYFSTRRFAEQLVQSADNAPLKEMVGKVTKDIYDAVYDVVETHVLSDLESNIQHKVQRLAEDTVVAVMTGQPWALERYPLAKNMDGDAVRRAIVAHCGDEVQKLEIERLEKEVERLKQSLEWSRR